MFFLNIIFILPYRSYLVTEQAHTHHTEMPSLSKTVKNRKLTHKLTVMIAAKIEQRTHIHAQVNTHALTQALERLLEVTGLSESCGTGRQRSL